MAFHPSFTFINICSEEVESLAKTMKLKLFRTSVKENFNVKQGLRESVLFSSLSICSNVFILILVFEYLCSKYLDRKSKERREMVKNQNVAHIGEQTYNQLLLVFCVHVLVVHLV